MALALSLVGQPVQPYLTTGATDFVNSVQKGKEDAIRTEGLKTQSQKSALDLLTAQKKAVKEEEVNSTMPELMGRIAKGELTDKQKSDFLQAHPEIAQKYIATNDEKAKEKVNNAIASVLLGIAHSTDKAKTASDGLLALKHNGIEFNLRGDESPEEIQDILTVGVNGMKALDATGSSVDASGRVVKTNKLGQVTDMGAAPTEKAQKAPVTWTVPNGRKETTYGYDANGKQIVLGVKNLDKPEPLEDSTNSFTPAAIDNAAARYNIDGTLPPMGMGKGGSAARSQILNRAAELASGVDGTDQRVNQLTTKASASTLLQLKKTKTMIKAFEEMANKNADIALELSTKVDRTGSPVVNRWFLAGNNKLAGDVDTATFNTAVNVFANEYAKIMSGSMGNTPVSDSARKEAHEILNTAQTPAQLRANIKLLQREMKNRLIGLDESEHELIQQMKSAGKKPTGNQVKQPQTPYEWYVLHWNDAQKKGDKVRMQKLTEEARRMGIAK